MDGFLRQPKPKQANRQLMTNDQPVVMQNTVASEVDVTDKSPKINNYVARDDSSKRPKSFKKKLWVIFLAVILIVMAASAATFYWYKEALKPVSSSNDYHTVTINKDTTYDFLVQRLKERGLIKSELATKIYGFTSGERNHLKEGSCKLKPSESTEAIIKKVTAGCHDFKSVTFYPGATIEKPLYKPPSATLDQTMYVKNILKEAGYNGDQIKVALNKQYDSPLFADKPANTSLEGYIYGETYHIATDASAEEVLKTTFDQMYSVLKDNKLIDKYQKQKLNLYQAITLASIIQRELNCEGKPTVERTNRCYQYQRTIAQIFLKRLRENISLGSDVTFIYAADMKGVTPTVDIDSPYNTRVHTGLPPGPIASPGFHALMALGNPSDTDYLFFIAGDDGLIYFAKTQAEHEDNIKKHCQQLCNEL